MVYLLAHTIDQAVQRDSDQEAFCTPGQSLTYGQIAERSNQLAHWLVDKGVRRGDRVGILMPRCLESAVSVYGIIKAGAAFVPIDPHLPVAGLKHLINDCGIRHLTTHPSQAATLGEFVTQKTSVQSIIGLDAPLDGPVRTQPWSQLEQFSASSPPAIKATEDDLAYIMYSSGSTGRPKGIMHTHRSGLSYAKLSALTYGVRPNDRIANHSPLHFDMSTFGYFTSPYAGATTVLIPEAYTKMAASLSQLMQTQRITIWYSVPLALIQLLERGVLDSRDLTRLRWVLFGGEPFPLKHLKTLMSRWPHARFANVYGPAEVNQCTHYEIPPFHGAAQDETNPSPVPIGSTWNNTEGLILDKNDQPVEDGQEGELLIRSPTMMRGYWARPDLNATAFYRQQIYSNFEKVYYRTGDLVRTREDGLLLFLGRKDRQIKVRGYRVELDDIEHTLVTHPVVEEAAVFPVRESQSNDRIEAVVVLKQSQILKPEQLNLFLSDRLSGYAVPTKIDIVQSFPRTTSGKIDRRRLQAAAEAISGSTMSRINHE